METAPARHSPAPVAECVTEQTIGSRVAHDRHESVKELNANLTSTLLRDPMSAHCPRNYSTTAESCRFARYKRGAGERSENYSHRRTRHSHFTAKSTIGFDLSGSAAPVLQIVGSHVGCHQIVAGIPSAPRRISRQDISTASSPTKGGSVHCLGVARL